MKKILAAGLLVMIITCCAASFFSVQKNKISSKARLGMKLFSEKMLSRDYSISCASCHIPSQAFADTVSFSKGVRGKLTLRNTPSVLNMKNRPYYFWDGRALTLQAQALMPIQNPDEMDLPVREAVRRLNRSAEYKKLFNKVFGSDPNEKNLGAAFSAYEKTLETVDSKFDDWSNDLASLTEEEERGRQLFIGPKAKCFDCHSMVDFTDDSFRNIGLFDGTEMNDSGRYIISGKISDYGKFKTPGLRNVAVTAPYMHNGKFQTLDQVLAYYNAPGHFIDKPINIDPALKSPLGLTPREKKDIIAFLRTLTDKAYTGL